MHLSERLSEPLATQSGGHTFLLSPPLLAASVCLQHISQVPGGVLSIQPKLAHLIFST